MSGSQEIILDFSVRCGMLTNHKEKERLARRSAEAKALENPIYRPHTYKPKKGKGAKYNRAAVKRREG
jgi:hypothetical protein